MSGTVYPNLATTPGLTLDVVRSYRWKTGYQEALSGKQSVISYQAFALVHFEFKYELLRDFTGVPSEIRTVVGLHNSMRGRYDTCLYIDPEFSSVTAQQFAVADGTAGPFQLTALYAPTSGAYSGIGASEIIQNLNGTPTLQDNGTLITSSNYTIGATGLVTFGAGHFPTSGHLLTWTGSFYYRLRFDEDEIDWTKFMDHRWQVKKVAMTSVIL